MPTLRRRRGSLPQVPWVTEPAHLFSWRRHGSDTQCSWRLHEQELSLSVGMSPEVSRQIVTRCSPGDLQSQCASLIRDAEKRVGERDDIAVHKFVRVAFHGIDAWLLERFSSRSAGRNHSHVYEGAWSSGHGCHAAHGVVVADLQLLTYLSCDRTRRKAQWLLVSTSGGRGESAVGASRSQHSQLRLRGREFWGLPSRSGP